MARSSTGSEVVIVDRDAIATSSQIIPTVANLNVTKSSGVHVGPKFVSVTQNVHNSEVIKGRILGLELVSEKNSRRLRCSIAVFVCWALIIIFGLAFYLIYFAVNKEPIRLDLDLHESWYLRRVEWLAMPSYGIEFLELPVPYVIIGHTSANYCNERFECIRSVLEVQRDHQRRGWYDIGPNFLVGGNGMVFEGRGANVQGVMVRAWNRISVSIMFLGDYSIDEAIQEQFDNVNVLLEVLLKQGILRPDYVLYGHCQISATMVSPGQSVLHKLHNFAHWNPSNTSQCLPR